MTTIDMNKIMPVTKQAFESLNVIFKQHGKSLFMVGGAVRDILQDKVPKDIDFTTNATPLEMMAMENNFWTILTTGMDHGTLTFMSLFGSFEITTMRKDVETDGRHAKVEFTSDLRGDAERRDFTMNAMFMDIEGNVFDFFGGLEDIDNNIVRFVGNADKRIQEDALRIMRFFRFVSKMDADFPVEDFKAISRNTQLLKNISPERIWDEIKKAVFANTANLEKFFSMAHLTGAMLDLGIPANTKFDRLDSVISDIPASGIFPAFVIGALAANPKVADDFADRFHVSNIEREEMVWFAAQVEEFQDWQDFGLDNAENMINDGINKNWIKSLASFIRNAWVEEAIDSMQKTEFPVTGQDLIDIGFKQGPKIGVAMKKLREFWKESRFQMDKDDLMIDAKRMLEHV